MNRIDFATRVRVWQLRLALCALTALMPAAGVAAIGNDVLEAQTRRTPLTVASESGAPVALDLQPLHPFGDDAQIVVVAADGKRRRFEDPTRYFAVRSRDEPTLRGVLVLRADGSTRGLLQRDGGFAWLQPGADERLHIAPIAQEKSDGAPFQCGNADTPAAALQHALPSLDMHAAAAAVDVPDGYRARIAIETDNEFLALFGGDVEAATAYVGSLLGFISTIYEAEVDTRLEVSFLRLWETPDPFGQSTTYCALLETGKYWNDNETAVERSTVHFMSGRSSPRAGIAWVGVMCGNPFDVTPSSASCPGIEQGVVGNYGGSYGLTMGIDGGFDAGDPAVVWDMMGVAHELGHNFGSPHTHCYNGYGGNPEPVDQCYSGEQQCFAGATTLPGPQGEGSGTLMSYCHLKPGSLANMSMTFGATHPFGVAPERVPSRMLAHVQERAAASAACMIEPVAQSPLSMSATPAVVAVGDTSTLATEGGSGTGAVSFAVSDGAGQCSIDGATLTALAAGSCEITATRAGDAHYLPATANASITVLALQAPLAIATVPGDLVYGDTAQVEVSGGSGTGASTLALGAGSAACALEGSTLTAVGIGTCEVIAHKAADAQFAAAQASLSLDIGRAAQMPLTLSAAPTAIAQGGSSTLSVEGGSGDGALALSVETGATLCTIEGDVLTAAASGTGTCTVTATKAGGSLHLPASASVDVGVFAPAVDLELDIVRTDPPPGSSAPGARSYRVSVTNHGPIAAPGVQLDVDAPAGLGDVLWTCDAAPACEPDAGSGGIGTLFELAIGGSAQVELSGEPETGADYIVIDVAVRPGTGMIALTPADDARRLVDGTGDRMFGDSFE